MTHTPERCVVCERDDVPLLARQRVHPPERDGATGYFYDELICIDCLTKENGEDGDQGD